MPVVTRLKLILGILTPVALLAITAIAYGAIPERVDSYAPIVIDARAPGTAKGRNIAVTINHVYSTPKLLVGSTVEKSVVKLPAAVFIVLDGTYETTTSPDRIKATLQADSRTVDIEPDVSGRPFGNPGLARRFSMVFNLQEAPNRLTFLVSNTPEFSHDSSGNAIDDQFKLVNPSIDSQLAFHINVDAIEHRKSVLFFRGGKGAQ
jgi:hypothetical protein